MIHIVEELVCGAGVGFLIGLTGVGGGVLVLPVLTVVIGLPTSVAVGTASFYALLTKLYAAFEHFRHKTLNIPVCLTFLVGAIPGVLAASVVINNYLSRHAESPEQIHHFQQQLKWIIIAVMVLSILMLAVDSRREGAEAYQASGPMSTGKRILGILLGFLVGVAIGATSIGGGVLIIPLLIIFFGMSTRQTVGSSIFIAVVLTLLTSIVYGRSGQVDFVTALIMWAGSLVGVYFGSRLCSKLSDKLLRSIVFVIICLSVLLLIFGPSGGH